MAQSFETYEGQPLTIPADPGSRTGAGAAGPKAEYLEYHRNKVFERP